MYAIVDIKGKQFKVAEDDTLFVPHLAGTNADDTVTFDRVLLLSGDDVQVGAPTVSGASVEAKVLAHVKADKVLVFKKKRRKRYKVTRGHRQQYTQVQIAGLKTEGAKKKKKTKQTEDAGAEA